MAEEVVNQIVSYQVVKFPAGVSPVGAVARHDNAGLPAGIEAHAIAWQPCRPRPVAISPGSTTVTRRHPAARSRPAVLQRAQIGGVGGALEPHQDPRHDLRRQLGAQFPRLAAQRLYFAGERVQPAALVRHFAGERIQPAVNSIQPAVNTVQAPAHVTQADPYLSHLAA